MKTTNFREVPLSEIIALPVYPVADVLPKLEKSPSKREEGKTKTLTLAELADSIMEHGQHEAIVLYNGQILDGRNRRWACELAAKSHNISFEEFVVRVEDFEGTEEEADEFVFTAGLDRRDLEPTQRAMSAALFEFNPDTKPAFDRMKEKARLNILSTQNNAAGSSLAINVQAGLEIAQVNKMLSSRFRVSEGYIKDARRILQEEQAAREAAERAQQRAIEYEKQEEIAKLELQEAVEIGDAQKAVQANTKLNNAVEHKFEEREKAAEHANIAATKSSLVENLHSGNKHLSEVRKERKEASEDPVEKARVENNKVTNDFVTKFEESADMLVGLGTAVDCAGVKLRLVRTSNFISAMIRKYEDIDCGDLLDAETNQAYWDLIEEEAAEHGNRVINSPRIEVAKTKPCGCNFSDMEYCEQCRP